MHATMEKAEACEAEGNNPEYQVGDKVLYDGVVVEITARSIVPQIHSFIYRWTMRREDNPGKAIFAGGWEDEKEFSPLRPVATG